MTYNIHPIVVHFPIAFLFLYSIVKIIPLRKWFSSVSWKQIERFLLFLGVLGAIASLYTGNIAERLVQPNHKLVEAHSTFAFMATIIYGLLLLGEIISILKPKYTNLSNGKFSKFLAVLGFISISVTGMLGGVMVYGLSADPFTGVILKLLGIGL